jgi:hypothetical protein
MTSPTPASSAPVNAAPVNAALASAWQAALAAEYQAVFGYGIVQAHLVPESGDSPAFDIAQSCGAEHGTLTQSISDAMLAVAMTPHGPAADYPSLYPVESAKDAGALAARLEDDCTSAWRALYAACAPQVAPNAQPAAPPAGLRESAQSELSASAVRATRWRKYAKVTPYTEPFPGL